MTSITCSDPILDEDGQSYAIQEILPASWTLLVLLRHAECIECNLVFHELNQLASHLRQWNIAMLPIGNGQPKSLRRVRERLNIDSRIPLYCHPSLQLHRSLDLHHGFFRSWGFKALRSTFKAFGQGHLQSGLAFPMNPQSGIVLLDEQHSVRWIPRSQFLGDIPPFGVMLEQILIHKNTPAP